MTKHIIVIGGESAEDMQRMTHIDEHIVASSGKTRPTVLYISTASGDDRVKIFDFTAKYESAGCSVRTLTFFIPPFPSPDHMSSLFEQADIIYVAGGNTRAMLAIWREFGVVGLLTKAWENGKVLCGVSAGAICWFEYGHSDSGGAFALIAAWVFCQERCVRISVQRREERLRLLSSSGSKAHNPPTRSMMASPCISRTADTTRRFITTRLRMRMTSLRHLRI